MGKRKHKSKNSHIRKKIRRLEKQLHRYSDSSDEYDTDYVRSPSRERSTPPSSDHAHICLSDSDGSLNEGVRSVVSVKSVPDPSTTVATVLSTNEVPACIPAEPNAPSEPVPGTSNDSIGLPAEILEALGDPKGKDEIFGPKIPDEISKRWGRILVDGMEKNQKKELMESALVPDNFRLVKAPILNQEIAHVLSDSVRNRDKLLEKAQNHLGLGIAGLTNLTSSLIKADMTKIEILKKISDISQIFLDLHYENTSTRRKLVITSLDKKFTSMVSDVKRDNYLFGANLGEKIKATKTAERSGLQIKRSDGAASSSRKYRQQGNWRGPPKTQGYRGNRQGGPKYRYTSQSNKRPPPAANRPSSLKTSSQTTRKTP